FPRGDAYAGYGCMATGVACGTPNIQDGYFMSQDQWIDLQPGIAAIAKLIPAGTVVDGMDLAAEAKAIEHRVTMYLKGHNWKIVDPNGASPPNKWGGSAVPYSNQLAKCANFITDNALGVSDYRDAISRTEGAALMEGVD